MHIFCSLVLLGKELTENSSLVLLGKELTENSCW